MFSYFSGNIYLLKTLNENMKQALSCKEPLTQNDIHWAEQKNNHIFLSLLLLTH